MAEEIFISKSQDRGIQYQELLPQIEALVKDEPNEIANLANIVAALKMGLNFFWVGFYKVINEELVLGPFQGPVACTRIQRGQGVCGAVWEKQKTIIVENVDEFPGHIVCNSAARSEIVVPVIKNGEVAYVLDVDSDTLNDFNTTDKKYLEKLAELVGRFI